MAMKVLKAVFGAAGLLTLPVVAADLTGPGPWESFAAAFAAGSELTTATSMSNDGKAVGKGASAAGGRDGKSAAGRSAAGKDGKDGKKRKKDGRDGRDGKDGKSVEGRAGAGSGKNGRNGGVDVSVSPGHEDKAREILRRLGLGLGKRFGE